jgi:PmbA protein
MDLIPTGKEILQRTLRTEVDCAEVYLLSSRATTIEVKDQKIDAFVSSASCGAGLRVLRGNRIGFSFASLSDGSEVDELIRNAVTASEFTEPDVNNRLPSEGSLPTEDLSLFDPDLSAIREEEKIDRAMALERVARELDSRIKVIRKAATKDSEYEVAILNSKGTEVSYRGTGCSASIMLMADDGRHQEMGWDSDFNRFYKELDVTTVGRRGAENALQLLGAKPTPTRKVPILLTPLTAVGFLEVLASTFSANAVQKGKSLFRGKIGKQVAAGLVQIIDDGLLKAGAATAPVDDEGVPMQRKYLIRDGVLQGFLHSSYTAAKEGVTSTGNAVRSGYSSIPHVGTTNLYIERGEHKKEELLHSMQEGLIVTEVMGMHTANPISGDFSVGISGLWVEKGKPSHPVRGGAIAGNLIELLKKVEGVGEDLRFFGSVGSPSLLIGNISVSGE